MRHARAVAIVVLLKLVLLLTLGPLLAHAKDPSSAGTYEGVGQGGSGGESSAVTTWVEDTGDALRFTFYVERFDAAFSAEGPKQAGDGSGTVPLVVDSMGVTGAGDITLIQDGEDWSLTGAGNGSGFGYEGSATLNASRVTPGMNVPGVGGQFSDMVASLLGGPPGGGDSVGADGATPDTRADAYLGGLGTLFSPAQPKPPITVPDALASTGLGLLALIAAIILA